MELESSRVFNNNISLYSEYLEITQSERKRERYIYVFRVGLCSVLVCFPGFMTESAMLWIRYGSALPKITIQPLVNLVRWDGWTEDTQIPQTLQTSTISKADSIQLRGPKREMNWGFCFSVAATSPDVCSSAKSGWSIQSTVWLVAIVGKVT